MAGNALAAAAAALAAGIPPAIIARGLAAFRAVRGESDDDVSSAEYARAMSRLDRALDELARAQEFFDRVVSADATAHDN